MVFGDLGKTNGLLIPVEQLFTDNYSIGQRFRFFILKVEETNRGSGGIAGVSAAFGKLASAAPARTQPLDQRWALRLGGRIGTNGSGRLRGRD